MNPAMHKIKEDAEARIVSVHTPQELEEFRISYFGKKGSIKLLMEQLKALSEVERKDFGREVNLLKEFLEELMRAKKESLGRESGSEAKDIFDETLPGIRPSYGKIHPISQTIEEISGIFERLGFELVDGPEIETEFYN